MDLKTVCAKGTKYASRVRVGRGTGSGKGKTSGRGHKGRGARSGASRRAGYEGGQMPIYRQVPKRGFTNARFRKDYTIINVDLLGQFDDGAVVDLEAILEGPGVSKNTDLLKVLGNGELTKKLTVRAQKFSKSAARRSRAGGSCWTSSSSTSPRVPRASAPPRTPPPTEPSPGVTRGPLVENGFLKLFKIPETRQRIFSTLGLLIATGSGSRSRSRG